MASLRDVDIGVVSRIDLKRRVMKTLALKLVPARDVVGASRANVGARVQNMNAAVEIGSRRPAEWLKTDTEWSIDTAAIRRKALVTDRVAKSLGRPLREGDAGVEKVRVAKVVGIIRA